MSMSIPVVVSPPAVRHHGKCPKLTSARGACLRHACSFRRRAKSSRIERHRVLESGIYPYAQRILGSGRRQERAKAERTRPARGPCQVYIIEGFLKPDSGFPVRGGKRLLCYDEARGLMLFKWTTELAFIPLQVPGQVHP
jgi:hypothetical protein